MTPASCSLKRQLRAKARFRSKWGLMTEHTPAGSRLDSWKAIAEYLQRDLATVRRWEKSLGLPVRRVAGNGRSVFAYTSEIDTWLQTANRPQPVAAVSEPRAAGPRAKRASPWLWVIPAAIAAILAAVVARPRPLAAENLRVALTDSGLIARDSGGAERWRHQFPATHQTLLPLEPVQVVGGTNPGVYLATMARSRQAEEQVEGGALVRLDLEGRVQRTFSFQDEVTFDGTRYGPPWAISGFAVNDAEDAAGRVAVTAHHHVWDPGIVTILDGQWRRRSTFVHAGWLEQVRWISPGRLLVAGFSNAHNGGMVALLDAATADGQGPEPAGSPHFCEDCGDARPLAMLVFPRTELNVVSASRFNRARVQTHEGGQLSAHAVEVPSPTGDAAALYEFTPTLELVSARFNERYWDMHRTLEGEGKLQHSREECLDREGPREIQMWEPTRGWRTVKSR